MTDAERHRCSRCLRFFANKQAAESHIRDVHRKRGGFALPVGAKQEREPSMADLMIDAQLNRAMGIRNEDWIEDMLP